MQQKIPVWMLILSLGVGGTGAVSGVGNWSWLENNEPRFRENTARLDVLVDNVARIEKHMAAIDARLDIIRETKVDEVVSLERVQRFEQEIRDLEARLNGEIERLERHLERQVNGRQAR